MAISRPFPGVLKFTQWKSVFYACDVTTFENCFQWWSVFLAPLTVSVEMRLPTCVDTTSDCAGAPPDTLQMEVGAALRCALLVAPTVPAPALGAHVVRMGKYMSSVLELLHEMCMRDYTSFGSPIY